MITTCLRSRLKRFSRCQQGATAVEYGLIASLIVVGILSALNNFSDANDETYNAIEEAIVID